MDRIRAALLARRKAMLEAAALVYEFDARGVEMGRTYSIDEPASEERRHHYRRVARIAERRHRDLQGLDLAT